MCVCSTLHGDCSAMTKTISCLEVHTDSMYPVQSLVAYMGLSQEAPAVARPCFAICISLSFSCRRHTPSAPLHCSSGRANDTVNRKKSIGSEINSADPVQSQRRCLEPRKACAEGLNATLALCPSHVGFALG